jgi:hypothetical protein
MVSMKMETMYSSETPAGFNGLHGIISQKTEFFENYENLVHF